MNTFTDIFSEWLSTHLEGGIAEVPDNWPKSHFKIVGLPDRKLAFHLVTVAGPHDGSYFQNLTEAFERESLRVVHIWEDGWYRHQRIVQSRVLALLGISRRVYARQTEVRRLDKLTVDEFLLRNHLQGTTACRYKYGLFEHEQLVAVATFAGPRRMVRHGRVVQSYELLRFANLLNHTVIGGLDKLIRVFERHHHPDDLMTYADRDWSNGGSYAALGFERIESTPPQVFWVDTQSWERHYPHRLAQAIPALNSIEEHDWERILTKRGLVRVFNAGNIKYLRFLGQKGSPTLM